MARHVRHAPAASARSGRPGRSSSPGPSSSPGRSGAVGRFTALLEELPVDPRAYPRFLREQAARQGRPSPFGDRPAPAADGFAGPAVEQAPALTVGQVFRRFWPATRPYRRWLWVSLAFVVISPLLDSAAIWLFKILVDEVLTPRDFAPFPGLAATYLGLTLAVSAIRFVDGYLSTWTGGRFVADLRKDLYAHVHGLSLDFFERRRLGDTLTRLGGDIGAIEGILLSGITSLVSYLLRIVIYAGVLVVLQWQLALVALTVTPAFWLVSRAFSRRLKTVSRENRRLSAELGSIAEESLSNAALVQAYDRQGSEVARYHEQNLALLRSQLRAARLRGTFAPITELLQLTAVLLVIGYGAWLLTRGRLTVGELLVFLAYFGQLYGPITGIARFAQSMSSATASAERVIEVLDLQPSVTSPQSPVLLTRVRGRLAMQGVSFAYPGVDRAALTDVDWQVEPGRTVAVVGSSGAGKSTFFKLLLRYYDPTAGSVRLDGHDLRGLDLGLLREQLAVVTQEALVFDGTIEENIRWGRPDATRAQLEAAVEAADVDSFLPRLPDGLATRVGQRGRRLSGGERQRVAIARAMLRDAPVLLLDEPTTGLDAEAGSRILQPLGRLMHGRTTVVISHDLLTVQRADEILVVEHGRIAERGTHHQLARGTGPYRRLLTLREAEQGPAAAPGLSA